MKETPALVSQGKLLKILKSSSVKALKPSPSWFSSQYLQGTWAWATPRLTPKWSKSHLYKAKKQRHPQLAPCSLHWIGTWKKKVHTHSRDCRSKIELWNSYHLFEKAGMEDSLQVWQNQTWEPHVWDLGGLWYIYMTVSMISGNLDYWNVRIFFTEDWLLVRWMFSVKFNACINSG